MDVYVVEALRYGDREAHSYIVGVFSCPDMARQAGKIEEVWRAGKYECQVSKIQISHKPNKKKAAYYSECTEGAVA